MLFEYVVHNVSERKSVYPGKNDGMGGGLCALSSRLPLDVNVEATKHALYYLSKGK